MADDSLPFCIGSKKKTQSSSREENGAMTNVKLFMNWTWCFISVCVHVYIHIHTYLYLYVHVCVHTKIWTYLEIRKIYLFNIPSLPRDVVDLTSSDPFLLSLCLQVWISVEKMIVYDDVKLCLKCMLKELKLGESLVVPERHLPQCFSRWEPMKGPFWTLDTYTVGNPVVLPSRTCLTGFAEGI